MCRAAAVTPTDVETDVDTDVPDPDEPTGRFPSFDSFLSNWYSFGDFIHKIIKNTEDRVNQTLSEFDTETCNSPQTGKCSFKGFEINNDECTIYTIGNCEEFLNENAKNKCQHKCKLPSPNTDDNETGGSRAETPVEHDEESTPEENIETTS
ncbi:hypothetical protein L9F63_007444 [Diploptera punctata]|uniref:Uncharacterized protein n=1 Tax=Diploptera punctata TaxID=6984 RepID=A0AAD7Z8F8_DIPPU|nr:hypothetical protein L9F63_007444 [Diploptera punctata]